MVRPFLVIRLFSDRESAVKKDMERFFFLPSSGLINPPNCSRAASAGSISSGERRRRKMRGLCSGSASSPG